MAKRINPESLTHPFRVGKKRQRAVLDAEGKEVVVFPEGLESMAAEYCQFLNNKNDTSLKIPYETPIYLSHLVPKL